MTETAPETAATEALIILLALATAVGIAAVVATTAVGNRRHLLTSDS